MRMFGKKNTTSFEKLLPPVRAQTMPSDFYGGLNPVVHFKKVEKEIVVKKTPALTPGEKKMLDQATAVGSGEATHVVKIFSNKKTAAVFLLVIFGLLLAGVGGYYVWQNSKKVSGKIPAAPRITVSSTVDSGMLVNTNTLGQAATPSTTSSTIPAIKNGDEVAIDFPSPLLVDSADLDEDDITDTAEDIFNTDPSKPDTDEDGYNDGHELFYLYNPAGKEPMRLVESGLVKEYKNPIFGYSVFYPVSWAMGDVDNEGKQVLFSTLTGENIEIRVLERLPQESFEDWFARWAPNQKFADLADFTSRFFGNGQKRSDGLVYYFYDTEHVYVVLYHTTDSRVVNYRSVISMMARSFAVFGNAASPSLDFMHL